MKHNVKVLSVSFCLVFLIVPFNQTLQCHAAQVQLQEEVITLQSRYVTGDNIGFESLDSFIRNMIKAIVLLRTAKYYIYYKIVSSTAHLKYFLPVQLLSAWVAFRWFSWEFAYESYYYALDGFFDWTDQFSETTDTLLTLLSIPFHAIGIHIMS
ncbi:MAG: hypothetical protein JW771_06590, partial [Candidatus Thermoplasmatota archaeon]|nr:hypothetical protein [Candidatus Thermoplasmatota archaeon]